MMQMQQRLDADVDRVSSVLNGDLMVVTARSMAQQQRLTVAPGDQILAAVARAFGNVSITSLTVRHAVVRPFFAHTCREAREGPDYSALVLV